MRRDFWRAVDVSIWIQERIRNDTGLEVDRITYEFFRLGVSTCLRSSGIGTALYVGLAPRLSHFVTNPHGGRRPEKPEVYSMEYMEYSENRFGSSATQFVKGCVPQ